MKWRQVHPQRQEYIKQGAYVIDDTIVVNCDNKIYFCEKMHLTYIYLFFYVNKPVGRQEGPEKLQKMNRLENLHFSKNDSPIQLLTFYQLFHHLYTI